MTAGEITEKAAKKAAEKVPSWIERILLPSLNEMKGELKAINTRIDSTNDRITSLENKMDTRITSLDDKITSLRNETKTEITGIRNEIVSLRNETKTDTEGRRKEMLSKFEAIDIKITSLDERITSLRNETKAEFTGLNYRFEKRLAAA